MELERSADSIEIGPPDTGFGGLQPTMISQSSSGQGTGKLRMHADLSPVGCDQETELARLLAAGLEAPTYGSAATKDGMFWPTRKATSSVCYAADSRPSAPSR